MREIGEETPNAAMKELHRCVKQRIGDKFPGESPEVITFIMKITQHLAGLDECISSGASYLYWIGR